VQEYVYRLVKPVSERVNKENFVSDMADEMHKPAYASSKPVRVFLYSSLFQMNFPFV